MKIKKEGLQHAILNGVWQNNRENENKGHKNQGLCEFVVKKLKISHPNSSQKEA